MISSILSRLVILLFGTLYPAYASYKAVRTKNVKEYVKWMMYWIVFALFTCMETVTDVFLSWFPFYYEIKIVLVIWLLSPATKGSSILYRKFVHPALCSREQEIDEYLTKAKEQSYKQVLDLGSKGVSALMQTAIKGGGGIVNQLKKSYSLSDLTDPIHEESRDEPDALITDPRLVRRRRSPHRSSSSTSSIYFSEVDVRADRITSIQSAEDISSGYSSGEGLYAGQPPKLLAREGLQRTGSLTRSRTTRVTRSTVPKKGGGSDDSDENEVFDTNVIFLNGKAKKISKLLEDNVDSSSSEGEFLDTLDTLHDNKLLGEDLNNFNKSNVKSSLLTACLEHKLDLDDVNCCFSNPKSSLTPLVNEKILNVEDNLNLVHITKNVDTFSHFLQNLIESKAEKSSNDETGSENVTVAQKLIETNQNEFAASSHNKSEAEELPSGIDNVNSTTENRGGKYNKKTAPPPPTDRLQGTDNNTEGVSPIKATLVLKPGVVKNLGLNEQPCKEVFIQSPKSKRRTLVNRSHSPSPSNLSRSKSSLSKLIKLPKKIGFWNKDDLSVPKSSEKRSSWHSFFNQDTKHLSDSKIQSKSDINLSKNKDNVLVPLHGANVPTSGSQLSIKSLSDSPLAYRRLKIIRRYVDEDID